MQARKLGRVIERLSALTPLKFDCGRLCGAACCRPMDEDMGMILFPGEEELFSFPPAWRRRTEVLPGWGRVTLICCDGTCERDARPLACRLFPLAPLLTGTGCRAVLDPRGRPLCPLCHDRLQALDPRFVSAAEAVFADLAADRETEPFLRALAAQAEQYRSLDRLLRGNH